MKKRISGLLCMAMMWSVPLYSVKRSNEDVASGSSKRKKRFISSFQSNNYYERLGFTGNYVIENITQSQIDLAYQERLQELDIAGRGDLKSSLDTAYRALSNPVSKIVVDRNLRALNASNDVSYPAPKYSAAPKPSSMSEKQPQFGNEALVGEQNILFKVGAPAPGILPAVGNALAQENKSAPISLAAYKRYNYYKQVGFFTKKRNYDDVTQEQIQERYSKKLETFQKSERNDLIPELNKAYAILSDPDLRQKYDMWLAKKTRGRTFERELQQISLDSPQSEGYLSLEEIEETLKDSDDTESLSSALFSSQENSGTFTQEELNQALFDEE